MLLLHKLKHVQAGCPWHSTAQHSTGLLTRVGVLLSSHGDLQCPSICQSHLLCTYVA